RKSDTCRFARNRRTSCGRMPRGSWSHSASAQGRASSVRAALFFLGFLGSELALALHHLHAKLLGIHFGLADLAEHLAFFFVDMMIDILAEHGHFGVEELVARTHSFELADKVFMGSMFDLGFVHDVRLCDGFTHRWVEDLFLDLRVHGELVADLAAKLA